MLPIFVQIAVGILPIGYCAVPLVTHLYILIATQQIKPLRREGPKNHKAMVFPVVLCLSGSNKKIFNRTYIYDQ